MGIPKKETLVYCASTTSNLTLTLYAGEQRDVGVVENMVLNGRLPRKQFDQRFFEFSGEADGLMLWMFLQFPDFQDDRRFDRTTQTIEIQYFPKDGTQQYRQSLYERIRKHPDFLREWAVKMS